MSIDIVEAFTAKNKCYQAGVPLTPQGLMLHSIGTPQPSAAVLARYYNQYQPGGLSVCVHAFVQADGTVYQTLPWEMRGWHCGGTANNTHIGIEMTEPGAAGAPGKDGADGITPTIGTNGHWYLGGTDTGKPSRGATGVKGDAGATGPAGPVGPQGPAGAPGKDGAGMDITGAAVGQIAKITAVDASGVPTAWSPADMPSGGSSDAVLYTAQTLTDAQKKQARENVDALGSVSPTIKDGTLFIESGDSQIQMQLNGDTTSATGEDFVELDFLNIAPQAATDGVVIGGLANFGDAELVGLTDTAVSYAQLLDYTKPLMLTYNNNQVTGASYAGIRRAIERGRQIKLSVANTLDIIASNAKNETDKSVLKFIETDVGGDTVFFKQYYVTAQTSGITVNVKSMELP